MNVIMLSSAVSVIIYLLFLAGIVFIEYDTIVVLTTRYRLRHRLSVKPEEGKLSMLCRNILSGALGKDIDGIWLISAEILIFITSFVVGLRNFSIVVSLYLAVFCSALPLLILYSRMQSQRNKGSKEGITLLTELYRQYKMNSMNMLKALELTIEAKGDFKVTRKQIYIMLIRLQDAPNNSEIKRCCRNLAYALGTNWSRNLATCIEISVTKGTDVSLALIDVIEQLKAAKKLAEERKRLNGEAMRMTVFLVPLLYIITSFVSTKYLNLPLVKFLKNQFFTPKGLFFFIVNLFLFVVNIVLINLIDSARMDY